MDRLSPTGTGRDYGVRDCSRVREGGLDVGFYCGMAHGRRTGGTL